MKVYARIFTYCKDCILRDSEDCPVSQWCVSADGDASKDGYLTMGDDHYYCGTGIPNRRSRKAKAYNKIRKIVYVNVTQQCHVAKKEEKDYCPCCMGSESIYPTALYICNVPHKNYCPNCGRKLPAKEVDVEN